MGIVYREDPQGTYNPLGKTCFYCCGKICAFPVLFWTALNRKNLTVFLHVECWPEFAECMEHDAKEGRAAIRKARKA